MPPRGGGRGGGGGAGGKRGPDLSWADDDLLDPSDLRAVSPPSNIPGPLFPDRYIRTPKPPTRDEQEAVKFQLSFRDRCRNGPLFCALDRTQLLDEKGKVNKRAGFDPFAGQDRYSTRHFVKNRTEPDLGPSGRGVYGYTLRLYPQELWGLLDPKQTSPEWKNVGEDSVAYASLGKRASTRTREKKRRRRKADLLNDTVVLENGEEQGSGTDSDEDPVSGAAARKRRKDAARGRRDDEATRASKQKAGLDAEDDFDDPDADLKDDDDEEGGEDEPEDEEFEDSDDGGGDYDAEQYFDGGDDEGDTYGEEPGGEGGDY